MVRVSVSAIQTHPRGLRYLFLTEAWERFSYYGMTSLVMLYMVRRILLPGNIDAVTGMYGMRAALELLTGPLTPRALASQIFGLYTAFVYFTPVLGGLLADRVLGVRRTVLLGGLLLAAGHFAMAFDTSFLIALLLLVCGTGCLKGNISAQVGTLYPPEDEERRTRGYVIFYTGINVGATLGPLVCGALAQFYGWHAGFALSGALMLLSIGCYLAGFRYFSADPPVRRNRTTLPPVSPASRAALRALAPIVLITIFQTIAYYQCFAAGQIWISERVRLTTPFGHIPAPWFNSVDALISVLSVPPLLAFWRWQAARGREPDAVGKIRTGAGLATACSLLLCLGDVTAGSALVSPLVPLTAIAGFGIALNFYWPPTLALVSRASPLRLRSTAMGVAYMSYFVANLCKGWLGTLYEPLGPARFWLLNTGVAATGFVLLLCFGRLLSNRIERAILAATEQPDTIRKLK